MMNPNKTERFRTAQMIRRLDRQRSDRNDVRAANERARQRGLARDWMLWRGMVVKPTYYLRRKTK